MGQSSPSCECVASEIEFNKALSWIQAASDQKAPVQNCVVKEAGLFILELQTGRFESWQLCDISFGVRGNSCVCHVSACS